MSSACREGGPAVGRAPQDVTTPRPAGWAILLPSGRAAANAGMPMTNKLCLNMIVKNEAPVIRRCLASVLPIIDYWVIVDTGSSDGTQEIIREFFRDKGVPGQLYEKPWKDFAHNRSEALALARPHADYTFIIDADDAMELPEGYRLPELTADSYSLDIDFANIRYHRTQLVRNSLAWYWRGVLHEFLECKEARDSGHLPILMRCNHDGARRRDPETYVKDGALLKSALLTETDPFLISRYSFYLAQSYRDCGEKERALEMYLARARLGFWQEEVFVALYEAAKLMEALERPEQEVIDAYLRAAAAQPCRTEALHGASRFCRYKGRNQEGYEIAKRGIDIPLPGGLFVEPWIYEYGLLDEFAVNGYWAGHYKESLDASLRILTEGKVSGETMKRIVENARFASERLPGVPRLGKLGEQGFTAQHPIGEVRSLRTRLDKPPRVLLAILAKQKEPSLPLYLECVEALDYPKSSIFLYVRTNNNTDSTEHILRDWIDRVGHLYAGVEFDTTNVADKVEQFGVHEWNPTRFRVLAQIRNISLRKALDRACDFYFVADVDNFIRPCTLRELVALNLPIVAPFLRSISPNARYSNYHAEIDANGYYQHCDQYDWIVHRWVRGIVEVPVVHTTYLMRADVLGELTYEDDSHRYEYVILSDVARKRAIPQYLDNRQVYGYVTFDKGADLHVPEGIEEARKLLGAELSRVQPAHDPVKFPEVFIINLDSRKDRWERISEACDRLHLPYTRISAIKDESGWIGCGRSHMKCISLAKEKRLPWIIIMEDDCEFTAAGIERLKELLPHLWATRSKWERFSGGPHFGTAAQDLELELYDQDYHLFYHRGFACHFDLIHEGAYDSILKWDPESCREIDTFYRNAATTSDHVIRSICTYPHIARQGTSASDINQATADWMPGLARYAENKLLEKIEQSEVDENEVVELKARHPHWNGILQLSKNGNVVRHKGTKGYGRFNSTNGVLTVDWYRYPSEEYVRRGDTYVLKELQSAAPAEKTPT
jgi:glycosyltransferase involved in cell wall biosynthesis